MPSKTVTTPKPMTASMDCKRASSGFSEECQVGLVGRPCRLQAMQRLLQGHWAIFVKRAVCNLCDGLEVAIGLQTLVPNFAILPSSSNLRERQVVTRSIWIVLFVKQGFKRFSVELLVDNHHVTNERIHPACYLLQLGDFLQVNCLIVGLLQLRSRAVHVLGERQLSISREAMLGRFANSFVLGDKFHRT